MNALVIYELPIFSNEEDNDELIDQSTYNKIQNDFRARKVRKNLKSYISKQWLTSYPITILYIFTSLFRLICSILLITFYNMCYGPIYLWLVSLMFYDGSKIIMLSYHIFTQIFRFFDSKLHFSLSFAFLESNNPSERNLSEESNSTIESDEEKKNRVTVIDKVLQVLTNLLKFFYWMLFIFGIILWLNSTSCSAGSIPINHSLESMKIIYNQAFEIYLMCFYLHLAVNIFLGCLIFKSQLFLIKLLKYLKIFGSYKIDEKFIEDFKDFRGNYEIDLASQEYECSLCEKKLKNEDFLIFLPCHRRHVFHKNCVMIWLKAFGKCPICEKDFTSLDEFLYSSF